ncbi:hypothetical protein B296_00023223 [Ensete ventricosum]|uniref:Uncharacterized protein n=1 Tax=Ensete ventricosum TaxID=4639 RepID=A0A426ZVN5_ENSVE|nr:hypothetical protein B296_00023223 [Ensete ventricosum]
MSPVRVSCGFSTSSATTDEESDAITLDQRTPPIQEQKAQRGALENSPISPPANTPNAQAKDRLCGGCINRVNGCVNDTFFPVCFNFRAIRRFRCNNENGYPNCGKTCTQKTCTLLAPTGLRGRESPLHSTNQRKEGADVVSKGRGCHRAWFIMDGLRWRGEGGRRVEKPINVDTHLHRSLGLVSCFVGDRARQRDSPPSRVVFGCLSSSCGPVIESLAMRVPPLSRTNRLQRSKSSNSRLGFIRPRSTTRPSR